MARSISSKKRVRQNASRRALNRWRNDRVKVAVRGFEEALEAGDKTKAAAQLKTVFHVVDTVAAKGTIHKNTASRKKSRLAVRLAKLG